MSIANGFPERVSTRRVPFLTSHMRGGISCRKRDGALICQAAWREWLLWLAGGLVFGPLFTFIFFVPVLRYDDIGWFGLAINYFHQVLAQNYDISSAPVGVRVGLALASLLGWLILSNSLFFRRRIVLHTNRGKIVLSSRFLTRAEHTIEQENIIAANVGRGVHARKTTRGAPLDPEYLYYVNVAIKDGTVWHLVQTTDESTANRILHWWEDAEQVATDE